MLESATSATSSSSTTSSPPGNIPIGMNIVMTLKNCNGIFCRSICDYCFNASTSGDHIGGFKQHSYNIAGVSKTKKEKQNQKCELTSI